MTFIQDSKTTSTLTQESRTAVGTLTQDSKSSSTLTADSRTAVGAMTQDSRTTAGNLWSSVIFPWTSTFYPWAWAGNGQIIIQDSRTL